MPFDLGTAKPIERSKFDASTAMPVSGNDEPFSVSPSGVPVFESDLKTTQAIRSATQQGALQRFGQGVNRSVSDTISSLGQLSANTALSMLPQSASGLRKTIERSMRNESAEVEARENAAHGRAGIAGTAGEIFPHIAAGMALPVPISGLPGLSGVLSRAGQAGLTGGLYSSAVTPASKADPGDFSKQKGKQFLTSAAASALLQPVGEAVFGGLGWLGDAIKMRLPGSRSKKAEEEAGKIILGKDAPSELIEKLKGAQPGKTVPEVTGDTHHSDIYKAIRSAPETGPRVKDLEAERLTAATDDLGKTLGEIPKLTGERPEVEIGQSIQKTLSARLDAEKSARWEASKPLLDEARSLGAPDVGPLRKTIGDMIKQSGNPEKTRALKAALAQLKGESEDVTLSATDIKVLYQQAGKAVDKSQRDALLLQAASGVRREEKPMSLDKLDDLRKWLNSLKDDPALLDTAQQLTNKVKGLFQKDSPYLRFLSTFEGESKTIDPFKSVRGEFATARDFERFTKDPEAVARRFLGGDQSGAKSLVELWGGKTPELTELVRSHFANKIGDMNPSQIGTLIKKNSGLLREFPEIAVDLERARVYSMRGEVPRDIVSSWKDIRDGLVKSGALEKRHVSDIDRIVGDMEGLAQLSRSGVGSGSRADMGAPLREAQRSERAHTTVWQALTLMMTGQYASIRMGGMVLGPETSREMSKFEKQIFNAAADMMLDPELARQMAQKATEPATQSLMFEIANRVGQGGKLAVSQNAAESRK